MKTNPHVIDPFSYTYHIFSFLFESPYSIVLTGQPNTDRVQIGLRIAPTECIERVRVTAVLPSERLQECMVERNFEEGEGKYKLSLVPEQGIHYQ